MRARLSTLTALGLLATGCAEALIERPRTAARFAFQEFSSLEIIDLSTPDGAGALYVLGEEDGGSVLLRVDRQDDLRSIALPSAPAGPAVAVSAQGRRVAVAFASGEVVWLGEGACCRFDPAPVDLAPGPGDGFWILTPEGLFADEAPGDRVTDGGSGLVPGPGDGVAILRDNGVGGFGLDASPPRALLNEPLLRGALLPAGRLYGVSEVGLRVIDGARVADVGDGEQVRAVAVGQAVEVWTAGPAGIGRVTAGGVETVLSVEDSPILSRRFTRMQADARSLTLTSSTSLLRWVFAEG